jgi:hypothetical protein
VNLSIGLFLKQFFNDCLVVLAAKERHQTREITSALVEDFRDSLTFVYFRQLFDSEIELLARFLQFTRCPYLVDVLE